MNRKVRPFVVIGAFWLVLFFFVVAGYSGSFGMSPITGYAVNENGTATPLGVQAIAILVLFFTNIVTMFFLIREMAGKGQ